MSWTHLKTYVACHAHLMLGNSITDVVHYSVISKIYFPPNNFYCYYIKSVFSKQIEKQKIRKPLINKDFRILLLMPATGVEAFTVPAKLGKKEV